MSICSGGGSSSNSGSSSTSTYDCTVEVVVCISHFTHYFERFLVSIF